MKRLMIIVIVLFATVALGHTVKKIIPGKIYKTHTEFKFGDPIYFNNGDIDYYHCKDLGVLGPDEIFDKNGFIKKKCLGNFTKGTFVGVGRSNSIIFSYEFNDGEEKWVNVIQTMVSCDGVDYKGPLDPYIKKQLPRQYVIFLDW